MGTPKGRPRETTGNLNVFAEGSLGRLRETRKFSLSAPCTARDLMKTNGMP